MKAGRLVAVLLAAALGGLAMPPPVAAEQVRIRSQDNDTYGRMIFDWSSPVEFSARITEAGLEVRFGRPLETSFDEVQRNLERYIDAVRYGDGDARRILIFTLKAGFDLNSYKLGDKVVIDLSWPAPAEAPAAEDGPVARAPVPPPEPVPAPALDELPVRYGEHAGFSRLVFEWKHLVDYKVSLDEDRARVSFDRPARADLTAVEQIVQRKISDLSAEPTDDGLAVEFTVAEGARLRYFRSGTEVVIDVLSPGTEMAAGPTDEAAAAASEPEPEPEPAPDASTLRSGAYSADLPSSAEADFAKAGAAASAAKAGSAAAAEDGSAAKTGPEPPATRSIPLVPDTSSEAPSALQVALLPTRGVEAEVTEGRLVLTFDWPEGVAAAAFRRAGFVWLVFDRRARLGLNQARRAASAVVRELRQVPTRAGTALRLAARRGLNPSLRRKADSTGWVVELSRQPLRPAEAIAITAEPGSPEDPEDAGRPRLALAIDGAGEMVEIADPEVGDTLFVIPVTAAGSGVEGDRSYVQFRLLGTAQGVVIEPRTETLAIERGADGIGLIGAEGLLISGEAPPGGPAVRRATDREPAQW